MPLLTLRLRIALAFLSIYTIWGSTYLAIRFAIETFPPFLMAAIRFLIAGGVLYAWMRLRGIAPDTGQLEGRDRRRGIIVARRKRWGDEGRTGDSLELGCRINHDCSNLDGSFGVVAKGSHRSNSTCRYRPSFGLRRSYSAGRTWRPRW